MGQSEADRQAEDSEARQVDKMLGIRLEETPPKHYFNLTLNPKGFGIGIRGLKTPEGVQVESASIIDLTE